MTSTTSNDFDIKLASNEDTTIIITLLKEVAQWLKDKDIDQWGYLLNGGDDDEIKDAISNGDTYLVLKEDIVIGTFTISSQQSDWDIHIFGEDLLQNSLYLHRLAITPTNMGLGIARKILHDMPCFITNEKEYIKLDCVANNAKLNNFYKSNDFEYIGITDGHSKYQKKLQ